MQLQIPKCIIDILIRNLHLIRDSTFITYFKLLYRKDINCIFLNNYYILKNIYLFYYDNI